METRQLSSTSSAHNTPSTSLYGVQAERGGGELDELGNLLEALGHDDKSVISSANNGRLSDTDALVLKDVDEEAQDEDFKLALALSMEDN